jgi:hypothetical protein
MMDVLTNNVITRCLVIAAMMIEQNKLYQGLDHSYNMGCVDLRVSYGVCGCNLGMVRGFASTMFQGL